MRQDEFFDKCYENRHVLIFAAGVATALIGKKVLESKAVKDAATRGMASVMAVRKDAEECFQDMKENAEDIVVDAHKEDRKKIYAEPEE